MLNCDQLLNFLVIILAFHCWVCVLCTNIIETPKPTKATIEHRTIFQHHSGDHLINSLNSDRNFNVNYKVLYNLRFDPSDLFRPEMNRSRVELTDHPHVSNTNDESNEISKTLYTNIQKIDTISSSKKNSNKTVLNLMEINTTSTVNGTQNKTILNTSNFGQHTSNNIIKSKNNSMAYTVELLGSRLKNLFFGSSPKFIKARPGNGKGILNLFQIIEFENSECTVLKNGIRELKGVCYHAFECGNLGGTPMGSCANGIGVCCVFQYSCGNSTRQAVSYFESPNYPKEVREPLVCVFTIDMRKNIKQILLEFIVFELNGPTHGNCVQDQFIVTGQNMNFIVPTICGINSGHHMFIAVEDSSEKKVYLSVFGKSVGSRAFNIKITQLEKTIAPSGCLQYYTQPNGIIKSFNYEEIGSVIKTTIPSYFNNLNYAICIKREPEKCSISFLNEANDEEYPFEIANFDEEENEIVPRGQAGAGVFNCPDDYVAMNYVRVCGDKLNDGSIEEDFTKNSIVKDTNNGPIVIPFRTNEEHVGRGFKLIYYQDVCT